MTEPFVMLRRELLRSDAWRTLSINGRRFLDVLMIEHMTKGGQENGLLKAPYEQLETFGVGARYVADAIRDAEELGLVDCYRGGMRVATVYALTWFPMHDGTGATNRWRLYRNPSLKPLSEKSKNLPAKGKAALPVKGKADRPNLPAKGKADGPKNLPVKGKVLIRSSTRAAMLTQKEKAELGRQRVGATCSWYVTNATGHRHCGKPTAPGREYCSEHEIPGPSPDGPATAAAAAYQTSRPSAR
jgi:hypothetical protein